MDDSRVVTLVGASEHVLKSRWFSRLTSWVSHYREKGSNKKRRYMERFPSRYARVLPYLQVSRVCLSMRCVNEVLESCSPALVLLDDKLEGEVRVPKAALVVRESKVIYKHHRKLMNLADNLANYFRILLKDNPKRFREELKKFEK